MFLPPPPPDSVGRDRGGGMRHGSLLLEAMIAIAVFSIFATGVGFAMILGERSTIAAGDRTRAAFLAEQSIEAVRYIRDQNFSSLTTGTYSPTFLSGGIWSFTPGASVSADGFHTSLQILSHGTDWFEAISRVNWDFGQTRSGSLALSTFLTNWRKPAAVGNWATAHIERATSSGDSPSFNSVALSGTAAFLTGTSSTGAGLYVFNIATPSDPVRIASAFTLGTAGYDALADNGYLYVATGDSTQDIRRYSIANPALLSAASLSGTYNLPVRAEALGIYGDTLFVGTVDNAAGPEFFALTHTSTGFVILDSLEIDGSVTDLELYDGYAYISSGYDAGELQVIDVFDPENLEFVPGRGMDLPEVFDANAIAAFGTSALIGRLAGTTIDELILYSIAYSPLPSPPPGPWSRDIGNNVNAIDADPGGTYGFLATAHTSAQFRTLRLSTFSAGGNPMLASLNMSTTLFDLVYDWRTDRVFAASGGRLFTIAPGP